MPFMAYDSHCVIDRHEKNPKIRQNNENFHFKWTPSPGWLSEECSLSCKWLGDFALLLRRSWHWKVFLSIWLAGLCINHHCLGCVLSTWWSSNLMTFIDVLVVIIALFIVSRHPLVAFRTLTKQVLFQRFPIKVNHPVAGLITNWVKILNNLKKRVILGFFMEQNWKRNMRVLRKNLTACLWECSISQVN